MSRGYRCILIALVGWLSLAAQQPAANTQESETSTNLSKAAPQVAAPPVQTVKPVESPKLERPCESGNDDRESDLCAQWKAADAARDAADWTRWGAIIGIIGTVGLLWTLFYTARGTRAAIDAVNTQVEANRPLIYLFSASVCQHRDSRPDALKLIINYRFENGGRSGAWMESQLMIANTELTSEPGIVNPVSAFIAPGKGFGADMKHPVTVDFSADESRSVIATKELLVWGNTVYRDAGGRRWRTGYVIKFELDNNLSAADYLLEPSDKHWIDERLPSHQRQWYQRLADKIAKHRSVPAA